MDNRENMRKLVIFHNYWIKLKEDAVEQLKSTIEELEKNREKFQGDIKEYVDNMEEYNLMDEMYSKEIDTIKKTLVIVVNKTFEKWCKDKIRENNIQA